MVRHINGFRIMALALAFMVAVVAGAADKGEDDAAWRHCLGLTGELTSSDTWQLEASYHWFPVRYAGIGVSLGMWEQYSYGGVPATNEWRTDDDSRCMMSAFLMPSLLLRTPALIRTESVGIGLMAEPGFMMNVPYNSVTIEMKDKWGLPTGYDRVSGNRGRWYAFCVRIGVYAAFDPVTLSLGYAWSDLDVYAMRRGMAYKGTSFGPFYPERKNLGGAFLRVAYSL